MEKALRRRIVTVLVGYVLFGFAYSSRAQDCPFAPTEAVADTLHPSGYVPLAIGHVWEYVTRNGPWIEGLQRDQVIADTLIHGARFFITEHISYAYNPHQPESQVIEQVRAKSLTYRAVRDGRLWFWAQDEQQLHASLWLGAPFASCYPDDVGLFSVDSVYVAGQYEARFLLEDGQEMQVDALKEFGGPYNSEAYAYGIGFVGASADVNVRTMLSYAKVHGREYGVPLNQRFMIRVGHEQIDVPVAASRSINAYPSPFHHTLKVEVNFADGYPAELAVYDVLGRREATLYQGIGVGKLYVSWNPDEALATGVYLLIAIDAGGVQVKRVVKI